MITFKKFWQELSGGIAEKTSMPYALQIINTTDSDKQITIFGGHENLYKPNFGIPEGITIRNLSHVQDEAFGYAAMLSRINTNPIEIGLIRLQGTKNTVENWTKQAKHPNGCIYSVPIKFILDPYQFQSSLIDLYKTITLDGDTSFYLKMTANSTLEILLYPSYEAPSILKIVNSLFPFNAVRKETAVVIKSAIKIKWDKFVAFIKKLKFW